MTTTIDESDERPELGGVSRHLLTDAPAASKGRPVSSAAYLAGMADAEQPMADTIWTVPNLFTLARLLCLPLFVWLLFGLPSRQAAGWLLGALGATDWVDGYLARRLHQSSEFGKKFDPTVDRLLFVVALVSIIVNDAIPIWFAVAVLAREVLVGGVVAIATIGFHMAPFAVTWWGKTATFLLMFAVPGFLLGHSSVPGADGFTVAAWVFGIPGLALSYYTAAAYVPKVREGLRSGAAA